LTKKPGNKGPRAPRAAKPSSTPKKPRAGSGGNPRAKPGTNLKDLSEDEVRHLFLKNRTEYVSAKAKEAAAKKVVDDIVTQAKSDGFTKKELDLSIDLADLKKEKKVIADVETRLRVARWIGHKMGAQMDLFAEPDRTPAVDRAFEEGKTAGLGASPRKSPYAQGLPQNEKWFEGFDAGQAVNASHVGRGPKDPPPGNDGTETQPSHSGMGMSRKDYQAQQVKERQEREAREAAAAAGEGNEGTADSPPAVH
jgi:ribosomal protein L17